MMHKWDKVLLMHTLVFTIDSLTHHCIKCDIITFFETVNIIKYKVRARSTNKFGKKEKKTEAIETVKQFHATKTKHIVAAKKRMYQMRYDNNY
jgi:hypothetical protein